MTCFRLTHSVSIPQHRWCLLQGMRVARSGINAETKALKKNTENKLQQADKVNDRQWTKTIRLKTSDKKKIDDDNL